VCTASVKSGDALRCVSPLRLPPRSILDGTQTRAVVARIDQSAIVVVAGAVAADANVGASAHSSTQASNWLAGFWAC